MKPWLALIQGEVVEVTKGCDPERHVRFRLQDRDTELVAMGDRFMRAIHVGDEICAVCEVAKKGKALVLDIVRCGPDETMTEEAIRNLLSRTRTSLLD
jgi:hypothetical protein